MLSNKMIRLLIIKALIMYKKLLHASRPRRAKEGQLDHKAIVTTQRGMRKGYSCR